MGLNVEFWGHVRPMCLGGLVGLLSKTQDEVWNFFEKLVWDTYEFEQVRGTLGHPIHGEYAFHVNPYQHNHFIDSHDHPYYSYVPSVLCAYCESSDYDVHTCPYHDYVDAICASLGKMMN